MQLPCPKLLQVVDQKRQRLGSDHNVNDASSSSTLIANNEKGKRFCIISQRQLESLRLCSISKVYTCDLCIVHEFRSTDDLVQHLLSAHRGVVSVRDADQGQSRVSQSNASAWNLATLCDGIAAILQYNLRYSRCICSFAITREYFPNADLLLYCLLVNSASAMSATLTQRRECVLYKRFRHVVVKHHPRPSHSPPQMSTLTLSSTTHASTRRFVWCVTRIYYDNALRMLCSSDRFPTTTILLTYLLIRW